jgi:hypothetical protein
MLSPIRRQIIHALLTRTPLYYLRQAGEFSFDLHVLSTPPAFILSQDQTLQFISCEIHSSISSYQLRTPLTIPYSQAVTAQFSKISSVSDSSSAGNDAIYTLSYLLSRKKSLPDSFLNFPGDYLLSHTAARAVPSAQKSLTSVFGMGTGVASSLSPPEKNVFNPNVMSFGGVLFSNVFVSSFQIRLPHCLQTIRFLKDCVSCFVAKPHDRLVPVS